MLPNPVPSYRQTAGFSCGAAALVMALNALRGTPVTRSFEFELWREATMIGVPGIDQWGLTAPALARGVPATVISENELTFPMTRIAPEVAGRFTEEQYELSRFAQHENRARAEAAGVRWERREPTLRDIEQALAQGMLPIPLVDTLVLHEDYAAPHWVVATAIEGETITYNDPDMDVGGAHTIPLERFWKAMDVSRYAAKPTIVVLGP